MDNMQKLCNTCNPPTFKPVTCFGTRNRGKGNNNGLNSNCKECCAARDRKRRENAKKQKMAASCETLVTINMDSVAGDISEASTSVDIDITDNNGNIALNMDKAATATITPAISLNIKQEIATLEKEIEIAATRDPVLSHKLTMLTLPSLKPAQVANLLNIGIASLPTITCNYKQKYKIDFPGMEKSNNGYMFTPSGLITYLYNRMKDTNIKHTLELKKTIADQSNHNYYLLPITATIINDEILALYNDFVAARRSKQEVVKSVVNSYASFTLIEILAKKLKIKESSSSGNSGSSIPYCAYFRNEASFLAYFRLDRSIVVSRKVSCARTLAEREQSLLFLVSHLLEINDQTNSTNLQLIYFILTEKINNIKGGHSRIFIEKASARELAKSIFESELARLS